MALFKKKQGRKEDSLKKGKELIDQMETIQNIEDSESQEDLPSAFMIDYIGTRKKSQVLTHLRGFVEKSFESPKASSYFMVKYLDGYLFEIQENGNGKSYLNDVLKKLENQSSVILILSSGRKVKVFKEDKKIKTILLTEKDKSELDYVIRKDKNKLLFAPSLGLFIFGTTILVLGFLSLSFMLVWKYILVNENEKIIYPSIEYDMPLKYKDHPDMKIKDPKIERILNVKYDEINGWKVTKDTKESN